MEELDYSRYNRSLPFPPANFEYWPGTRIGALGTDVLIVVIVILLWVIPRKIFNTERLDQSAYTMVSQFKLWGFWVAGVDTVRISEDSVIISKIRGLPCCTVKDKTIPRSDVIDVELRQKPFLSVGVVWAFFVGCLCGIWVHFIPCFWWTCDFGYYDGQGFRGALWVVIWAIVFFILCDRYRTVDLVLEVRSKSHVDKTNTYWLAVGEGEARQTDDPVAEYDHGLVKEAVFRYSETNKFKYVPLQNDQD